MLYAPALSPSVPSILSFLTFLESRLPFRCCPSLIDSDTAAAEPLL